jgi:hypothetical protein
MKRIEYRTGTLGRTSGPSLSVMGLLESHVILGVVLCGLSIVHKETKEKVNGWKEIIVRANT